MVGKEMGCFMDVMGPSVRNLGIPSTEMGISRMETGI
jgi:hypothetical protein